MVGGDGQDVEPGFGVFAVGVLEIVFVDLADGVAMPVGDGLDGGAEGDGIGNGAVAQGVLFPAEAGVFGDPPEGGMERRGAAVRAEKAVGVTVRGEPGIEVRSDRDDAGPFGFGDVFLELHDGIFKFDVVNPIDALEFGGARSGKGAGGEIGNEVFYVAGFVEGVSGLQEQGHFARGPYLDLLAAGFGGRELLGIELGPVAGQGFDGFGKIDQGEDGGSIIVAGAEGD